eukprot:3714023-Amphidinium_carterae.1
MVMSSARNAICRATAQQMLRSSTMTDWAGGCYGVAKVGHPHKAVPQSHGNNSVHELEAKQPVKCSCCAHFGDP